MDWFLYDRDFRHERVKIDEQFNLCLKLLIYFSPVLYSIKKPFICTANQMQQLREMG